MKKSTPQFDTRQVEKRFLIAAISFLLLAFVPYLFWGSGTVDIQIHATYIVLPFFQIPLLLGAFMAIQGLLYFFIRRVGGQLLAALANAHFWMIFLAVFTFSLVAFSKIGQGILDGQFFFICLAISLLAFFLFITNLGILLIISLFKRMS